MRMWWPLVLLFVGGTALCTGLPLPAGAQVGVEPVNISNAWGPSGEPAAAFDASGVLHAVWADNPGADSHSVRYVFYSRSRDGGATFEVPRRISSGVDNETRAEEIRLAVAGEGHVAVAWWAVVPGRNGAPFLTVFAAQSVNGGETFAPASPSTLAFRDNVPATGGKRDGFANFANLSLALDSTGDVYLLATIQDYYHGYNVYFARTADRAFADPVRVSDYTVTIPRASQNALAVLPSGAVYAVWTESQGDFFSEIRDVFAARSDDGGRTFADPEKVPGAKGAVAAIVRLGRETKLLAQVERGRTSKAAINLFGSTNGGESYTSRVRVGVTASYSDLNRNSIVTDGAQTIAVGWTENESRPGFVNGIYVATSRDAGASFEAPRLVEPGLFFERPALVMDATRKVGVLYTSAQPSLADRDVLFRTVELP